VVVCRRFSAAAPNGEPDPWGSAFCARKAAGDGPRGHAQSIFFLRFYE